MSISKDELEKFVESLEEDSEVYIDDGGLTLISDCGSWLEVGGQIIEEDDEE